jgi:hypothetical protein
MFERLKFFMSAFGWFWQWRDTIQTITNAWSSYPGIEDEVALRAWVRPLLTEAAILAAMTPTPIDDKIVDAAVKLVNNDRTWTMIHALALLGQDAGWVNGVRIPRDQQANATFTALDTMIEEVPENPALILTALGILLSLIQLRRGK